MENSAHETQTVSSRKQFFRRLFTWRMARRMLIGLAGLATVIAIFYTVENWRGKRAWENYKREAEAKGAVLDWNAFIPPPVPDEQNIFKAPKMQEWFVGKSFVGRSNELSEQLKVASLIEFTKQRNSETNALVLAEIIVGQSKPDNVSATLQFDDPTASAQMEKLVKAVVGPSAKGSQEMTFLARSAKEIKPMRIFVRSERIPTSEEMVTFVPGSALASFERTMRKRQGITPRDVGHLRIESTSSNSFRLLLSPSGYTAADYLAWSDQFETNFDLIREALKRPYARMDGDYRNPVEIPIPNFVCLREVTQTLAQRAQCFLLLGQPERALHELKLIHDMSRLLEAKPTGKPITVVAAMVNVAITGLYTDVIADGMRLQAWREPQLAALQEQLQEINLPPFIFEAFNVEKAGTSYWLQTIEFSKIMEPGEIVSGPPRAQTLLQDFKNLRFKLYNLAPRGWAYQNMVSHAKMMDKSVEGFDLASQIILPRKQAEAALALEAVLSHLSPYNFVVAISVPNFVRATQRLAEIQTKADQTAVVCALERYRLAHGNFPETLDALTPDFIKQLPHDIIGGQPLKYRRTDDGKFLLYSVGWNEKDDGGAIVATKGNSVSTEGDWVWQDSSTK